MWNSIASVPVYCRYVYFVITSLGEERAGLYAYRVQLFVYFAYVTCCRFRILFVSGLAVACNCDAT